VAPPRLAVEEVSSSSYLAIIWKYLTEALCEEVFAATRINERRREWTLFAMVWFWMALLQSRYTSQTRALQETQCGSSTLFPHVEATPEAFFQKAQRTRPEFFRNLCRAFTDRMRVEAPRTYETELPISEKEFADLYALDGSRLAKVGRLLKVARETTNAIIPGSMEVVYDLRRGIVHDMYFDPDGCVGEIHMFEKVLDSIPKGALVAADRYYPKPVIWRELGKRGISMVSRYNRTVKKRRVAVNAELRSHSLSIDDHIVDMGRAAGVEPVRLRLIRMWGPKFDITLVTNVLDPKRLSPEQLLAFYRRRWSVERMYLALKEILDLNHLFNASPAAVGQQVYTTAMLYNALRMSQARIADIAAITPEKLSPDKLFPTLISHYVRATDLLVAADLLARRELRQPPDLSEACLKLDIFPWLRLRIRDHLLEKRSGSRRKRRYCKGRSKATSYKHIKGARKLLLS
jgi:hypothetical protein